VSSGGEIQLNVTLREWTLLVTSLNNQQRYHENKTEQGNSLTQAWHWEKAQACANLSAKLYEQQSEPTR
jgi:hypothetical protein